MNSKNNLRGLRSSSRGKNRQRPMPSQVDAKLWVDTWTALEEYLRVAPEMLQSIEVEAGSEQKLAQLLSRYQSPLKPAVVTEIASSFRAEIEVPIYAEHVFFEKIDNIESGRQLLLALDQITDTRNLGAIARSAAYFGLPWLIMPKDRQASITNAAVRTGQGAFAFIRVVQVTNLSRCLKQLKERGYWVLGTDMDGEPLPNLIGQYDKSVLVMGSEDRGMRDLTRRSCDRVVAIPAVGGGVESLNVAVAAAIFMHQLCPRV